jgi:hypothetical protein
MHWLYSYLKVEKFSALFHWSQHFGSVKNGYKLFLAEMAFGIGTNGCTNHQNYQSAFAFDDYWNYPSPQITYR